MPKSRKFPRSEWTLDHFEPSREKGKKYAAIIRSKQTSATRRINFGASDMDQYKDSTGLGKFSSRDHGDLKRRRAYRARHRTYYDENYLSPAYFSWNFLW